MQLDASIFKAYDIRGIVPVTVTEAVAEGIGKAFGTVALAQGETRVAVGRDGRLSGPALSAALVRGLVAAGIEVIDVGMVTTPMLYFAASTACSSGIQVTGSHNPRDYNGFKMVMGGRAIYGEDIQTLRRMMEAESWLLSPGGTVRNLNVLAPYIDRIVGDITLARKMKIVVDCGNGIAGASAPAIFRAIGCDVVELFSEVDGNFPNHHPDPSKPENLRDLMLALKNSDAAIGLAFDGDGDRRGPAPHRDRDAGPAAQGQAGRADRGWRALVRLRAPLTEAKTGGRHPAKDVLFVVHAGCWRVVRGPQGHHERDQVVFARVRHPCRRRSTPLQQARLAFWR